MTLIFLLHELIWLICFNCTLTSPILGPFYSNDYQPENLHIKKFKMCWSGQLARKSDAVEWFHAAQMSHQRKFSTISNKNDSFVLYDLIWLIHFICTLTSPELGHFYRNGYQPETGQRKVACLKSRTTWIMESGKGTKSQMVINLKPSQEKLHA